MAEPPDDPVSDALAQAFAVSDLQEIMEGITAIGESGTVVDAPEAFLAALAELAGEEYSNVVWEGDADHHLRHWISAHPDLARAMAHAAAHLEGDRSWDKWAEKTTEARARGSFPAMDVAGVEALREAIRHMHGCDAAWVESVPVTEVFNGQTVWDGEVQVFDLTGHPKATRAYAWSYATEGTKRRFVAVLRVEPVDGPVAAVRAAIAAG